MDLRHFFTSQAWWGKVLCAILGFMIAGPMGAFLGIFIGNLFDRGLTQHFTNPLWYYHIEKRSEIKQCFLEATFSTLGHIAKSDGRVSEQEIQLARTLMHHMHLNRHQQKVAQQLFTEGKNTDFKLQPVISRFQQATRDNQLLQQLFINIQYEAAQLDGMTEKKIKILDMILTCLQRAPIHEQNRFHEDYFNQYRQQQSRYSQQEYRQSPHTAPIDTLAKAFATLQVKPDAAKQEVKRAYRKLISQHHPDKLIAQGASRERIREANEKTQMIRKAWEAICNSKGW